MSLELPPLVRSGVFILFMAFRAGWEALALLCFSFSILGWGIPNYIAHGSIISVFMVS